MILIDFSSILHRMINGTVPNSNARKENGLYVTKDFIGMVKYFILQELFTIERNYSLKFGNNVICLDKSNGGYWRKDVYFGYKAGRKKNRDASEINYQEVFAEIDELLEQFKENIPWKVIEVDRAEADDSMLVLAKEYCDSENILIHSPDKDMLQAQRDNNTVFQYSALTKKWLVPENKHDHMGQWILEHVCLGDVADEVPKVVDHTEFSDNFLKFLEDKGFIEQFDSPYKMIKENKAGNLDGSILRNLFDEFDVYKLNRKGEATDEKDIYKSIRFGPTTLHKAIESHGSLDAWLDSHPLYRSNYERNFTLVMEEGVPDYIRKQILQTFVDAKTSYNVVEFEKYLDENSLSKILMELPASFKPTGELTAEDYGW